MRRLLPLLFLLALPLLANAQKRPLEFTVLLRDGSVLHPLRVEAVAPNEYAFELEGGIRVEVPAEQIRNLQKLRALGLLEGSVGPWQFFSEVGVHYFMGRRTSQVLKNYRVGVGWSLAAGLRWRKRLALTLGTGLDGYEIFFLPVAAGARWRLRPKGGWSPSLSLHGGWSFPLGGEEDDWLGLDYRGGPMIHPAVGVEWLTRRGNVLALHWGYRFQRYEVYQTFEWDPDYLMRERLRLRSAALRFSMR
ncbi:MAG: hypothetical protein D6765_00845, partial [Bacteroidetes bacterium]